MKLIRIPLVAIVLALSVAAHADPKLGVCDSQRAFESSEFGKKTKAALTAERDRKQKLLDDERDQVTKMRDELDKARNTLTDEALTKRQEELRRRIAALQVSFEKVQREMNEREEQVMHEMAARVQEAAGKIAEREHLDLVVEKSQAMAARGARDLTDDVIRELDRKRD